MEISFKNRKLEKSFNEGAKLVKTYGSKRAKKIRVRMAEFRAAESLHDFLPGRPPSRCHELVGARKGQLSVDLDHPYRLIFVPDHNPVPIRDDGGLNWSEVTAIRITEIEDTHE